MIRGRLWGRREVSFSCFFFWRKKNMLMDGWEGGRMNDEDGMWPCLGLEIYT